jgi:hypothetical protein
MRINKYHLMALALCILMNACAPPPPPSVVGDYRPINRIRKDISPPVFDFTYEGDVVDALYALRAHCPQLEVLPPIGKVRSLSVKLDLQGTTLENALHVLGEKTKQTADIVLNPKEDHEIYQAFLVFKENKKSSVKSTKRGTK